MSVRECEAAHCSGADNEINEICKQLGWPIGNPVLTRDSQGPCTCTCSCLALNTPIMISKDKSKAVQDIKKGEFVFAAGLDLVWNQQKVIFSEGSQGSNTTKQPGVLFINFGDDQHLVVLPDTLFLMPDKKLKRADKLSIEDYLVSVNGEKVIINGVGVGEFRGGFHHIATDIQEPNANLDGHLVVANGVVCADYALQIKYHSDEYKSEFDKMPTVGTKFYNEKYGIIKRNLIEDENFILLNEVSIPNITGKYCTFISDEDASKHLKFGSFRDFTDPVSRSWIDYLFTQYKLHYPEINFSLDWDNETVNAYAWRTDDGSRFVQILGGLVRSTSLELEGLALVIAHEIGHHYGGEPTHADSDLSCEGQADYYGARNVMRKVWFGEFYLLVMEKAIIQLSDFFDVSLINNIEKAAFRDERANTFNACDHPPGVCRIETYNAALDLKPKPICAG